jgi:uncharacterized membrane protein YgcG
MLRLHYVWACLSVGKTWDWSIAMTSAGFGVQLMTAGRVLPLPGLDASLRAVTGVPVCIQGALLMLVGALLSYVTGRALRKWRVVANLVCLSFYMFSFLCAVASGHSVTAIVCGVAAGVSAWRVIALTRDFSAGGRHGSGRNHDSGGNSSDDGGGRVCRLARR